MIVIDNSRGSLAASDPYQNPAEAQAPWLERMLADARARGIPAIVVGSRELNPNLPPALNVATDAAEEAQIMVRVALPPTCTNAPKKAARARSPPAARSRSPSSARARSAIAPRSPTRSRPANRTRCSARTATCSSASKSPSATPPRTSRRSDARLIPLVQEVSLDPVDGTLLRRSAPALFTGLGRRPLAGDRWGPISASSGNPNPPGSDPLCRIPARALPPVRLLERDRTGIHVHLLRT